MTLTIRCQKAFTDTTKPFVRYDPILSTGSLLLIDPTHPAIPWDSGIPADGTQIPNVAINEAKVIISGTDSDVKPTFYKPTAFTGSAGLIERTSKGGVHGIPSQTNAVSDSGPQIVMPLKIIKHLLNYPRHSYYVSAWSRFTRVVGTGAYVDFPVMFSIAGQFGSDYGQIIFADCGTAPNSATAVSYHPSTGTPFVAAHSIGSNIQTTTPVRFSVGTADWYNPRGTYPSPMPGDGSDNSLNGASATGVIGWGEIPRLGSINPAGATFTGQNCNMMTTGNAHNRMPSMILYRFYLEDLTVSGRTYATVDAIDAAQYAVDFNASTGRYGSDTFTAPSTIP